MKSETKVYFDADADLSVLKEKTIAMIGYGNQGRSHALNMRDSGLDVIVGNIKDDYWEIAEKDGFKVYSIDKAAELGDILFIIIPDEVQGEVYEKMIKDKLKPGKALVFASGFSIHFEFIIPPNFVDVLMEAPRMWGPGVRDLFVKKLGFPTLIAVHQDASGKAKEIVLAIAKAVGATRVGAFESSFEEEAVLDLFTEQGHVAGLFELIKTHFEIAVKAGYNPDIIALEMWKSGELLVEMKGWIDEGIFKQMKYHSPAAQYGMMTKGRHIITDETRKTLEKNLEDIQSGVFARDLMMEREVGYPVLKKLTRKYLQHPINKIEEHLDKILRRK